MKSNWPPTPTWGGTSATPWKWPISFREFRLSWIEEPLMPHEVESHAELKRRCPWQRWSCGEHSYTKWDFKLLLNRRAVDILQPDANQTGGITEMIKICALAEAAGLPVMPHSNETHNTHVVFSRAAHVCPRIEYFPDVEPDTGNELFGSYIAVCRKRTRAGCKRPTSLAWASPSMKR